MTRLGWVALNLAQALFAALWTFVCVTAALLVLLVTASRDLPLAMARRAWAAGLLWVAGCRLEVTGLEGLDLSGPVVFVANHESMLDIPVIFRALPVNLHFILKKELRFVPLIGWYAWAMGMIFVDRGNQVRAIASLKRVGQLIRGGRSVIAYPEGTRARGATGLQPFKKGVFVAAIEAGVPVVPVALIGTGKILPPDGLRVRPGTVHVVIGKPIPTGGMGHGDRNSLCDRTYEAMAGLFASHSANLPR